MKKLSKLTALALTAALGLSLTACGGEPAANPSSGSASDGGNGAKHYKIGVVQLVEHNALDAATKGFTEKVNELFGAENVTVDVQNAQGEPANCTTIITKFVNAKNDLIMANATPAAQAAAQATAEIPIICTSVTDLAAVGLVEENAKPGRNVTGASDLSPIDQHVTLMGLLCPEVKSVGILYCSSEENSILQADQAEAAFTGAGYTVTRYTAADTNELQTVVTKAAGEQPALYIPTDNVFANNMEIVKNITVPAKIPVICGEENMAMAGGLATYSVDYYTLGQAAGQMAYDVLVGGQDIKTMAVKTFVDQAELKLIINQEIADAIGITIPADLQTQIAG